MKRKPTFSLAFSACALTLALALAVLAQAGRFAVQLEALPARAEAEAKVNQLKAQGVQAYIVKSLVPGKGLFFRIRVGNFTSRALAERYGQQLKMQSAVQEFFITAYEAPEPEAPANVAKANPTPTPAPVKPQAAPVNTGQPVATGKGPSSAANSSLLSSNQPALNAPNAPPATTPAANKLALMAGYTRYQDTEAGYSFELPQYWVVVQPGVAETATPKPTARAMFQSNEDGAFLNAIWNRLDKANDPDHDNDMIVDLILRSMSNGNGAQNMQALARRVVNDGAQIKTFLDLKAALQVPNQPAPLDFLGKGVIIRASKGILLVVAFYTKDAPQTAALVAEHIVQTARTPE
jgi:hypothetical protein